LLPLFRAVIVWAVLLATVLLPRLDSPSPATAKVAVTQLIAYDRQSIVSQARAQRAQAAQEAQISAWSRELQQGIAAYQADQAALAKAKVQADYISALNNHPGPPAWIGKIITDAFSPLGARAVQWAMNVAYCESRYHPNSVNVWSGATGLFQFMKGTWGGTPWASKSRTDPVANAQAAAWLYNKYGPGRWSCTG
jgi:hypothetical protein